MATTKVIWRIAITDKYMNVNYVSRLLYNDRELAVNEVKKLSCKKEENIERHRWQDVCFSVANRDTWRTFEIIRNDSNKRYIGIIPETLVFEE